MSLKGIDIYRTASIMGYSLLPIVFLAALSIVADLRGWAGGASRRHSARTLTWLRRVPSRTHARAVTVAAYPGRLVCCASGAVLLPSIVIWCTSAATLLFVVALEADDQRWCAPSCRAHAPKAHQVVRLPKPSYRAASVPRRLFAYPILLFYTCFALITIF